MAKKLKSPHMKKQNAAAYPKHQAMQSKTQKMVAGGGSFATPEVTGVSRFTTPIAQIKGFNSSPARRDY